MNKFHFLGLSLGFLFGAAILNSFGSTVNINIALAAAISSAIIFAGMAISDAITSKK